MSDDPPLPFLPGQVSNGEFVPPGVTARDRDVVRLALATAEQAARRRGMDRRRFLQSSGGMAAMLAAVNVVAACAGDDGTVAPATSRSSSTTAAAGTTTTEPGGSFEVPDPEDVEACEHALGGAEFIFDVHTHHVMPDGPWRQAAPRIADMIRGLVPAGCVAADPYECVDRISYVHDLFLASDTTVSLLSDVPNSGDGDAPVPFLDKVGTKEFAASLGRPGAPRVLVHDVIAPNFGDLGARLDGMSATAASGHVAAFKVYTAWGPARQGYALDDPAIGLPVVERARQLGVKVMCGHKGLPLLEFDRAHNGPADMVAVAAQYPDMDFVVYHSAYEIQTTEGPYDPDPARRGVDSLLRALDEHGIPPNSNVWAELGTTWRETMSNPTEAAHVLGKLLTRVGQDRVLWGTDGIWYGSPQPQIMAFRAFQISPRLQEQFGYPALTPAIKAKVFGLNAAQLFGVDPDAQRCGIDGDGLARARAEVQGLTADGAIATPWFPRGPLTRREVLAWLRTPGTRWSPF